jgi:GNAT superfamily N-acetyltransferase
MNTVIDTRRAAPSDVDVLLDDVAVGFDSYREFAPAGWQPPDVRADRGQTTDVLEDPATWALLALAEERAAGHVAFFPGRERTASAAPGGWRVRRTIPGLAHLWQLFVLPEWWGRGVAPLLHEAAIAEMRVQGYRSARLFTPSRHARARRFYERRGWMVAAEEWNDYLGLMLTEYRRVLGGLDS